MIQSQRIINLIRWSPVPLTTAMIAGILDAKHTTVSSRLSKLYLYGKIDKDIVRHKVRCGRGWTVQWKVVAS